MKRGRWTALVVMTGAIAIVGCGGGSGGPKVAEKQVSTTTTSAKPTGLQAVRAYFKALDSGNATTMQAMIDGSVPGSVASKYATIEIGLVQAESDSGSPATPSFYSEDGNTIRTCDTSPTATSTTTSPTVKNCTDYTDFVVDKKTHKLSDFKANGGDISTRIVTGGAPQTVLGATITPIGGYRGVQSDTLFVIYDVAAGGTPVDVQAYSANYVTPDGRQVAADSSDSITPSSTVQPGARVRYVSGFPAVDVGGHLAVPLDSGAPDYQTVTVNIPLTNG